MHTGVGVIGVASQLAAAGLAQRRIAGELGAARSTVRGWLARLIVRAEVLRAHFLAWLLWLAPSRSRAAAVEGGPVTGVAGVTVRVAALDDVIAAKEAAGRGKDLAALPALYARDELRRPPP